MKNENYSVTYSVDSTPTEVFDAIIHVRDWWSGLYGEEFEGASEKLGDEFSFRAGGGMHYSKQKLVELIPGKKVVWLVTDSELAFLTDKNEWTGTKISFDISPEGDKSLVRFTHEGLVPEIECYNDCSTAWAQYLQRFLAPILSTSKNQG